MLTYKALYKRTFALDNSYPMFCNSTETWVCSNHIKALQLARLDCPAGYEVYHVSIVK